MVLKLSGHVRNTISLLYKQKTGWNSDIWNFFNEKIDFFSILVYFHWNSAFWVRPCLKTSLWRHTLTDFHDFGINGKRRPYPIPWYQTIILWVRQFQVHEGVVTTPLGKPCYKKRLGRTRVNGDKLHLSRDNARHAMDIVYVQRYNHLTIAKRQLDFCRQPSNDVWPIRIKFTPRKQGDWYRVDTVCCWNQKGANSDGAKIYFLPADIYTCFSTRARGYTRDKI